jgi:hypothetical protein
MTQCLHLAFNIILTVSLCAAGAAAIPAAVPAAAMALLKSLANWRRNAPTAAAHQRPAAAAAALELEVWCLLVHRLLLLPSIAAADSQGQAQPSAGAAAGAAAAARPVAALLSSGAAAPSDLAEAFLLPLKAIQFLNTMQKNTPKLKGDTRLKSSSCNSEEVGRTQQLLMQLLPGVSRCWCSILQAVMQALSPTTKAAAAAAAVGRPHASLQQLLPLQSVPKALLAALEGFPTNSGLRENAFAWLLGSVRSSKDNNPAAAAAAAAAGGRGGVEVFHAAGNMVIAAGQLALQMSEALSEQHSVTEAKAAAAAGSRTAAGSVAAAAGAALTPPKSPLQLKGTAAGGNSGQLGSVVTGYTASMAGTAAATAAGGGSSTLSAAAERGIAKAVGRLAVQQQQVQQVLVTCLQLQLGLLTAAADALQGNTSTAAAAGHGSSGWQEMLRLSYELSGTAAACLCGLPDAAAAAALLDDQVVPVLLQLSDGSSSSKSSKAGKAPVAATAAAVDPTRDEEQLAAAAAAVDPARAEEQLAIGVLPAVLPVLLERLLQLQAAVQQQQQQQQAVVSEEAAEEALHAAYRTIQR